MASPNKRRHMDIMKLMMSDYRVNMVEEDGSDFYVAFAGPKDTPYEGGEWEVHVGLPSEYPYRSPSIGFKNRMYHPNVDLRSGTICLDVINQTWSPMFDLVNIFDVFLPQLLHYPNPTDPLNNEAASLLLEDPSGYVKKVKEYVCQYAGGKTLKREDACSKNSSDKSTQEGDLVHLNISIATPENLQPLGDQTQQIAESNVSNCNNMSASLSMSYGSNPVIDSSVKITRIETGTDEMETDEEEETQGFSALTVEGDFDLDI